MPDAKLRIDLPQQTWIAALSSAHPEVRFEVVTSVPGDDAGLALVRVVATDPLPIITAVQSREDILDVDLLWKHDDEALLQIETTNPLPLRPIWRASVPLRMPFSIQDGTATWRVTTSTTRLSKLRDHLQEAGIEFTIEFVREVNSGQADRLVTDRQQEVLATAVEAGYYRTPREATLGDVAGSLDIAKATCSEVLHRAEGHIIHWFVDEHMVG